jgi:O-antigen/teichoic acid export membrane protein
MDAAGIDAPAAEAAPVDRDLARLAKGGRTNFFGFLLRLAARLPFLFIAGRLYGADALGRFASALVVIELASQICTLGQKRGIAQRLSEDDRDAAHVIADGVVLTLLISAVVSLGLFLFPAPMFPSGEYFPADRWLVLAIGPVALTDIALASLAYRFDVGATVRARSVVEPWTLSIAAGLFWAVGRWGGMGSFGATLGESGLALSFVVSVFAALLASLLPLMRSYGRPRQWTPHPLRIGRLALDTAPLAVADVVEWGTRRLDIAILGLFAVPASVGVYYVAQQVASLPQKLKTSFEPILGPVITRNLKEGNLAAIASQVCQVGFWITAAQAGIALALGIPGDGVLGLVGPQFTGGMLALAFLLGAEVCAAPAVVSEAALIYIAPMQNLWVSLATIVLQAVFTLAGMLVARGFYFDEMDQAASAAGALLVTLSIASFVKSRLLAWHLGHRVETLRWSLVAAAVVASAVGWAVVSFLPEWAQLSLGVPAILGTYGLVIWRFGFGPADRLLFRKQPSHSGDAA